MKALNGTEKRKLAARLEPARLLPSTANIHPGEGCRICRHIAQMWLKKVGSTRNIARSVHSRCPISPPGSARSDNCLHTPSQLHAQHAPRAIWRITPSIDQQIATNGQHQAATAGAASSRCKRSLMSDSAQVCFRRPDRPPLRPWAAEHVQVASLVCTFWVTKVTLTENR